MPGLNLTGDTVQLPVIIFAIRHITGEIIWGLATHFWISPKDYQELQLLRKRYNEEHKS